MVFGFRPESRSPSTGFPIGAALRVQGHDVRIIPAQFVKPFVKSNKNDFIDAEAIAEAVTRQNMRFVPIKYLACRAERHQVKGCQ
jgi:transposase